VCMQWFLCLFVEIFPTQAVMRLWDIIMCSGKNVLIQVVLQLVKTHQQKIITCKTSTEYYEFCKSFPSTIQDADSFFKEVLTNFASVNDNVEGVRKRFKAEIEEALKKIENLRIQKKTQFSIPEIQALRTEFSRESINGTLSRDGFERIMHDKLGTDIPFVDELFQEFDSSGDRLVDFREFSVGLSMLTHASAEEKLRCLFQT